MERRLITPAEAALLLAPAGGTAAKCIQAGLLSLLDAGRIAFEQGPGPLKRVVLILLPLDAARRGSLPAHLEALGRALAAHSRGTRLDPPEVVRCLQRAFGVSFRRFVHDEVAPSLIKRGLLTRTDGRWFGLFPRIIYRRTPAGEALAAPLERLKDAIDDLPALIKRDPDAALRLARSAGVMLVMSPTARRQIPALRALFDQRGGDSGITAYVAIDSGGEDDERIGHWLDIGDLALEFDLPSLFDSIDAVGDATGGGDGGGSDGGGNGGGGD